MSVRPVWLAVASIVALGLLVIFAMCRAAARADKAAERGAALAARCPECRHDHIGAAYCGAPLAGALPHPSACWCTNAWHLAPDGPLVVRPTQEDLDRMWLKVAEAINREKRGDR
jgi:hypothetical protein